MNKSRLFYLLCLLSFVGLLFFCLFSPFFDIAEISVNDNSRYDFVVKYSGIRLGANIFMFNQFDARKRIIEMDKQIKDVRIKKCMPSRVEFVLIPKEPVLLYISDGIYGITREGELIKIETEIVPNLPIFTGYEFTSLHSFLPDSISNLLFAFLDTLFRSYKDIYINLSEIKWDAQDGLGFYLIDRDVFVVVGRDGFNLKLSRLERVLSEIDYSSIKPVYIDLNYSSQAIVRYKPRKGEG